MTTNEFINRCIRQPVVSIQQEVSVFGPTLKSLVASSKYMRLSDILTHPDHGHETRTMEYAHVLGEGLRVAEIEEWQATHPQHVLPADLKQFLTRVNGIHLWADLETSRAYFGVLPLNDWQDVLLSDQAILFDSAVRGMLSISYDNNGDYRLVLNTAVPEYVWFDLEDLCNPQHIGPKVADLLDFWWNETSWLDPRTAN